MHQLHSIQNWAVLLITLTCLFVAPALTFAQQLPTIHVFVVTQNEANIGAPRDKQSMQSFTNDLKTQTGVPVVVKFVDNSEATETYISQMITNANVKTIDAVWFYYSGHGSNYDGYPQTQQHKVPLSKVHQMLKNTQARLTIASYDCCTVGAPIVPPNQYAARLLPLKYLFLESKGNVKIASCQSNAYSYGSAVSGGIFTNSFLDGMKNNTTWGDVTKYAEENTVKQADRLGYIQKPKLELENMGTNVAIDAPEWTLREDHTVETLVADIQESINNSIKNPKTVTFEDIMRWNIEINRENFESYAKKKHIILFEVH